MALLDPNLYSGNVLVVGDGNFSFTVCLVSALSDTSVKITATSLDSRAALESNDFAVENIAKISASEKVEILHEVDATDLSRTFGSRIFDRVIFNFPHVGGKSNIGKSRELLERFFASAAKHVVPYKGDICVSLCQGQGGTPLDNPRRELGNTWQVVYQAAKADLILNAVYPFGSTDYFSYQSAGFRGQLGKGFHTVNGLTHVFVHGLPLETVPDVEYFISSYSNMVRQYYPLESLSVVPDNPVYIVTNKLNSFFLDINVGVKDVFRQFEDISSALQQVEDLNTQSGVVAHQLYCKSLRDANMSLSSRVLKELQGNGESFVINGTEIDFSLPPSSQSHPISHKMVALYTSMEAGTASKVKDALDRVIEVFMKEVCSNLDGLRKETSSKSVSPANPPTDQDLMTSEIIELKCGRQTKFKNVQNAASAGIGCECCKQTVQEKCIYCRVERKYLGHDICPQGDTDNLFQPSTQTKLYHGERLILSCGILDSKVVSTGATLESCIGWLMVVNLDHLAMSLTGIPDIRLLWSGNKRFKKHFSDLQGIGFQDLKEFVPLSLFPPTYTHDISFWITEHMTERQFFQDIYETTQGCVHDVQFIERYHDPEQDKVSYNYRMVYSSCDRPLTHIQTVKMQNLLRRKLLNCNFQLK